MAKIKYIMIHHTAVSYERNPDQFKANNNYHKAQWNFRSSLGYYLGYNYEISSKGRVRKAREEGERTAACYQNNMNSGQAIHIALDGNFDIEKPKPEQIFALRDLLRDIVKRHDIKKENIIFHNAFANKSCPGNNMDLNFIRSLAYPETVLEEEVNRPLKEEIRDVLKKLVSLVDKL